MKPKFQADADLNEEIVSGVIRKVPEIDFQTAEDAGLQGVPDDLVLKQAAVDGRILISHDRRTMPYHFAEFLQNNNTPGLFILSKKVSVANAIDEIVLIWAASSAEEYENLIKRIPI